SRLQVRTPAYDSATVSFEPPMKRLVVALAVLTITAYLTERFPIETPIFSSSLTNTKIEEPDE
ncbi:hypothetical protein, partial [Paraburkholderia bannensis]|uniref:hypothetical protein n=1 Tax=Paraburkholderia bannensis TaxID=765414 RepID=UPI002AB66E24